jgi:peptidoglycan DL-endopeptidase CwlO
MAAETGHRAARRLALLITLLLVLAAFTGTLAGTPAQAAESPAALGNAALNWAEGHETGLPYQWAGAGPGSYDCSGGVMAAFAHADGISLPHNTVSMVDSGLLVRVWGTPQRGDLAMWGPAGDPYHVGFVTSWHDTAFGPLSTGTPIGWYSWQYWPPAAFYQVR